MPAYNLKSFIFRMLPIVGVFLLFLLANECRAQKEFEFEKDYEPHILAIDGRGYARVPKDPRRKFGMEGNEYKNYLNMMERAIVQQFRKDSNTQVVIYIHGGAWRQGSKDDTPLAGRYGECGRSVVQGDLGSRANHN